MTQKCVHDRCKQPKGGRGVFAGRGDDWVIHGWGGETVLYNAKEWGNVLVVGGQP